MRKLLTALLIGVLIPGQGWAITGGPLIAGSEYIAAQASGASNGAAAAKNTTFAANTSYNLPHFSGLCHTANKKAGWTNAAWAVGTAALTAGIMYGAGTLMKKEVKFVPVAATALGAAAVDIAGYELLVANTCRQSCTGLLKCESTSTWTGFGYGGCISAVMAPCESIRKNWMFVKLGAAIVAGAAGTMFMKEKERIKKDNDRSKNAMTLAAGGSAGGSSTNSNVGIGSIPTKWDANMSRDLSNLITQEMGKYGVDPATFVNDINRLGPDAAVKKNIGPQQLKNYYNKSDYSPALKRAMAKEIDRGRMRVMTPSQTQAAIDRALKTPQGKAAIARANRQIKKQMPAIMARAQKAADQFMAQAGGAGGDGAGGDGQGGSETKVASAKPQGVDEFGLDAGLAGGDDPLSMDAILNAGRAPGSEDPSGTSDEEGLLSSSADLFARVSQRTQLVLLAH